MNGRFRRGLTGLCETGVDTRRPSRDVGDEMKIVRASAQTSAAAAAALYYYARSPYGRVR